MRRARGSARQLEPRTSVSGQVAKARQSPPSDPRLRRMSLPLLFQSVRAPAIAICLSIAACHAAPPTCPPASVAGSPLPAAVENAAKAITPEFLRERIATISSDAFQGRGPATAGDRAARAYLVEQLAALGAQPGGGKDR